MNSNELMNDLTSGLGALVWWDLEGTAILPEKLRDILRGEGEDPSQVPDVDPLKGLRRAVGAWTLGRGKQDRFKLSAHHSAFSSAPLDVRHKLLTTSTTTTRLSTGA